MSLRLSESFVVFLTLLWLACLDSSEFLECQSHVPQSPKLNISGGIVVEGYCEKPFTSALKERMFTLHLIAVPQLYTVSMYRVWGRGMTTVIAEIFVFVKISHSSVRELSYAISFRTARTVPHTLLYMHGFRMLLNFVFSAESTKSTKLNRVRKFLRLQYQKISFSHFSRTKKEELTAGSDGKKIRSTAPPEFKPGSADWYADALTNEVRSRDRKLRASSGLKPSCLIQRSVLLAFSVE